MVIKSDREKMETFSMASLCTAVFEMHCYNKLLAINLLYFCMSFATNDNRICHKGVRKCLMPIHMDVDCDVQQQNIRIPNVINSYFFVKSSGALQRRM